MTIGVAPASGGSVVTVDDTGAPLTAGGGCDQPHAGRAGDLPVPGLYIVFVDLGDGDDALAVDNHDAERAVHDRRRGAAPTRSTSGPLGEVCLDGNAGVDHLTTLDPVAGMHHRRWRGQGRAHGQRRPRPAVRRPRSPTSVLGQGGSDYVYGDDGDDQVDGGPGDEVLIEGGAGRRHASSATGGNDSFRRWSRRRRRFEGDSGADTFSSQLLLRLGR